MSTLLVDNYDSYTYNVFHLLAAVSGEEPIVIHNDMISWRALSRWDFDAIVLSPGPGRPQRWHDFGVCSDILRFSEIPVLGVCLGHQGLGHVLDATVTTAPMAMHGRLSQVEHDGSGLFADIPHGFSVVRYHSLAVTGSLGPDGRVIAWTGDGIVMGIEHCRRPLWGVQFHPESIATEHGRQLFENFYALARRHRSAHSARPPRTASGLAAGLTPGEPAAGEEPAPGARETAVGTLAAGEPTAGEPTAGESAAGGSAASARPSKSKPLRARPRARKTSNTSNTTSKPSKPRVTVRVRSIDGEPSTELLFERLFRHADHAFWLDSADAPTALAQCSYLGATLGPNRTVLEYDVTEGIVSVCRGDASAAEHISASIFDVLDRELASLAIEPPPEPARGLLGGFVGYLGYECKADCGSPNVHHSDMPDAVLMFANRLIAVDHVSRRTHLLALCCGDEPDAQRWLNKAERIVSALLAPYPRATPATTPARAADMRAADMGEPADATPVTFQCGRGRERYLADIARCQSELAAGESYEVCLTDQISTDASPDPFELYRVLRHANPAPFAAYLKLGEMAVVSSSPERFLSVDRDRRVQARPIKGTAPRSPDPLLDEATRTELEQDEKTFAEHLMIVDLLRNDLGRVCEIDSVRVPELMVIEQYATVHQMISNVTGTLESGRTPVQCVRACFPGGSMTGAPKLRTMGIIDDIERVARGVYSGALGYFGLDGSVDLSIVIRTIVLRPGATTIGAGGAIVMQSDPAEEFAEILLKARAPMRAIAQAVTGSDASAAWTVELEPASPAMAQVA